MCHPSDYDYILEGAPSDEERAAMATIPAEPERRPRDVSGPFTEWTPTWGANLPAAEDALEFARTLVFGQRGRIACQRPSFDPLWCIVHSEDFADGESACEAAR